MFAILFVVIGCGSQVPAADTKTDDKGGTTEMDKETKETLDFTQEETTHLPDKVAAEAEKLARANKDGGELAIHDGERTYFIVALGERPTGGFTIQVVKVEKEDGHVHVYAAEEAPAKDAFVTQVISYPYTVVSVEGEYAKDDVTFHVEGTEKAKETSMTNDQ